MNKELPRREILKRIEEYEKKGLFSSHVDPIDYDNYYKVDKDYPYILKDKKAIIKRFFTYLFEVKPFIYKVNKDLTKTIVKGKENIKNIKSAVVISNHVYKFDCLVQQYALSGHKTYITAAEFNNQKGHFGDLMRDGRMLPLSSSPQGMKNFIKAIDYHLKNGHYVVFYPESSMWWMYEKPRPFASGAFNFAFRNNVPIIPSFITFISLNKKDEEEINKKQFVVNILKPIYPDLELNEKDAIEKMKEEAFLAFKEKYESFYHKELKY